jgi:hypothetical protein
VAWDDDDADDEDDDDDESDDGGEDDDGDDDDGENLSTHENGFDCLILFLFSPSCSSCPVQVWALGNVAGDSWQHRNAVLECNVMPVLLSRLSALWGPSDKLVSLRCVIVCGCSCSYACCVCRFCFLFYSWSDFNSFSFLFLAVLCLMCVYFQENMCMDAQQPASRQATHAPRLCCSGLCVMMMMMMMMIVIIQVTITMIYQKHE